MNNLIPDDGLSAYFDEEVSSSERAAIARHLSESPSARRELAEIRRLSELLREGTREAAPEFFVEEILNRLLSIPPPVTSNFNQSATTLRGANNPLRPWWWVGKALAVIAAAVLLMLPWWSPFDFSESEPTQTTQNAHKTPAVLADRDFAPFADNSENQPGSETFREADFARDQTSLSLPLAESDSARFRAEPPQAGSLEARPAPAPAAGGGMRGGLLANNGSTRLSDGTALPADPQVGQIMSLARQTGDQVLIVEVTVVDVQQTLGQVQVLFAQHAVPPGNFALPSVPSSETIREMFFEEKNALYGLYVQSTSAQIATALTKLRQQKSVAGLEAKTTLAMHQIPVLDAMPERRSRAAKALSIPQTLAQSVFQYESQQAAQTPRPSPAEPAAEAMANRPKAAAADAPDKKSPAKPNALKPDPPKTQPAPPVPAVATFGATGLNQEAASLQASEAAQVRSFQLMVQTPTDEWFDPAKTPKPSAKTSAPLMDLERKPAEVVLENRSRELSKDAASAPVRLMLVFRQQTPPMPAR